MRKTKLFRAALLTLALLLLFGGVSGAAFADTADDSAAVLWSVNAKDGSGNDVTTNSAEELNEKLGSGFALVYGRDASITAPTVADLRRGGVTITPPAGYTVSSAFLVAEGGAIASGSRSLLSLAAPVLDGSNALALPAAIFAEGFDASSVGSVFNGSGSSYVLQLTLERVAPDGQITLSYGPGALSALDGTTLVSGGNTAVFPISGGRASGKIAALDATAADTALRSYAKQFTGWKLLLSNGASALLNGGESFSLSSSATLEAQWKDVVVFAFTGGEKLYDGTPLTGSYTRSGTLRDGDELSIPDDALTLSRTDAGESTATLDTARVSVTRGGADVTGEYEFAVIPATLRVVQRGVTFTVTDVNCEYDGSAHSPSAYILSSGELADGHSASAVFSGQQTLPGSSTGSAAFTIRDAGGSDVTANYNVSVINGSIRVTARSEKQPLTVTIRDVEKEYDGSADLNAAYSLTSGSLLGSDRLVAVSFTGSISGVGTGSVGGSFAVYNGETDVSENYEITVVPGKLTIKPRAIVLTADSAEKDFDGTPLTKDGFTLSSGTLMADHTVSATVTGSQTEVGSSANKIGAASVVVTDKDGKNVTGLYSIRLVDGTLTVKSVAAPTAITITMKSAEKVYDGTPLTSKDYEITSGALAEGDTLVPGTITGEQTDAGSSSITAAFSVKNGEKDVTAKYTITLVPGKLTVKARPITITAASASKIYDGRALTSNSYKISSGELVKGHKLTATVTGSQTALGSSANVVDKSSVKITDASGKDVTANYSVTTAAGTLTVNRDPVTAITLTVGDGSKVYDGKPYRFIASDIRVTSGSLPAGYTIEATFNPEAPVDVGKYEVTIKSVTIRNAAGADVTAQFNITRVKGSFSITARPLTIETKAANKVYDGTALTERSTPTITGRVEGHQVTLRITGSQTKVGSSENTVADVKITDKESGANVTKNYAITYQYGLLTVSEAAEGSTEAGSYSWVNGSSGTLYIRFDHSYDGFEGLQVDGKDLDRSNYTSSSGSTDIWLKSAYLNTLSSGAHTLTAKYAGGETVKTSFSVEKGRSTRTGDNSRLGLWLLILATALVAFFAAAWYLFLGKNRRWKRKPAKKNK